MNCLVLFCLVYCCNVLSGVYFLSSGLVMTCVDLVFTLTFLFVCVNRLSLVLRVPAGLPSCGGDVIVYVKDINQPSLATPLLLFFLLLFCSCVHFCLYGPFNCISFHKFSWQLSAFSLCSSGLISAVLVLSTLYLVVEVFLGPDIILCSWLGLKHRLTN